MMTVTIANAVCVQNFFIHQTREQEEKGLYSIKIGDFGISTMTSVNAASCVGTAGFVYVCT
jgi:hypothetical protein